MKNNFPLQANDTDKTPLIETGFYQWAQTVPRASVDLLPYLAHLGFEEGKHKISESDYEFLHHATDYFHRASPWIAKPCSMAELFSDKPATPGADRFYVSGFAERAYPSAAVFEALGASGWVYEVNPNTTYFEVVTPITGPKCLYAKYQQILGSRKIAIIQGG